MKVRYILVVHLVCLRDLKTVGFNLLNTTNNHSMDYGHVGLLVTLS